MNNRRKLLIALGAGLLGVPRASFAQQQQGKVPRIGFLISETLSNQASRIEALQDGLRDYGYVKSKNILIEVRSAEGHYDRLPSLAMELALLPVEVIVAFGIKAVVAAKGATSKIPIVVPATTSDLVAMGFIKSHARPGGNITGSTMFGPEIAAKQVEILKQAVPHIKRVAVLLNPANAASGLIFHAAQSTASSLKLEVQRVHIRAGEELGQTFSEMAKGRTDAIAVSQDTLFGANASTIAKRGTLHRLPSVGNKEFAEAGGLLGYGANNAELYRRGAYFVDKILKGAKPADLPVEQPMTFELIVNLRTAKALGLTMPPEIMVRATRVIR